MGEPISLNDVPRVGSATASKLRQIGIATIEALAVTPIREITDKTDMGLRRRFKSSLGMESLTSNSVFSALLYRA